MFLAEHPGRAGSSDTSSGKTPIHSVRGSPDTCHPGVPRGNARTCLGSLSHPRSVAPEYARTAARELSPHGADRRASPPRAWLQGLSLLPAWSKLLPKPSQPSCPARTAGHLSRARQAHPPNGRRARRQNSPGCTARPGREAGQRRQRAEARSHAPQEDHSLRRR